MSDRKDFPVVIALGYFDSVHKGHKKVIEVAKEYADKNGYKLAVFTFGGNLKAIIGNTEDKSVYLPCEREKILKELGADEIYFAPITQDFLNHGKLAFLNMLNRKYHIKCYVSGNDYTFGRFGKGSITDIAKYANKNHQQQIVVDTMMDGGEKISTTLIKSYLEKGDIEKANYLLGREYSVCGKVYKDRQVGRLIGFPTANIKLSKDKFRLKDGVYQGKIIIDGKTYDTITNYGTRPTFSLNDKLVEAHIIDYDGDLYGKEIRLYFIKYMRGIKHFDNKEQLKNQLTKDVKYVRNGGYYD